MLEPRYACPSSPTAAKTDDSPTKEVIHWESVSWSPIPEGFEFMVVECQWCVGKEQKL
jgi:hypothetical protein